MSCICSSVGASCGSLELLARCHDKTSALVQHKEEHFTLVVEIDVYVVWLERSFDNHISQEVRQGVRLARKIPRQTSDARYCAHRRTR